MKHQHLFGLFAALFAPLYFLAVDQNIALFTYHPRLHQWAWGTDIALAGPAMYWYGWLASAAFGAALLTLAFYAMFERIRPPHWLGWSVPLLTICGFIYTLRGFFIH
jgi:hypothetical protein